MSIKNPLHQTPDIRESAVMAQTQTCDCNFSQLPVTSDLRNGPTMQIPDLVQLVRVVRNQESIRLPAGLSLSQWSPLNISKSDKNEIYCTQPAGTISLHRRLLCSSHLTMFTMGIMVIMFTTGWMPWRHGHWPMNVTKLSPICLHSGACPGNIILLFSQFQLQTTNERRRRAEVQLSNISDGNCGGSLALGL